VTGPLATVDPDSDVTRMPRDLLAAPVTRPSVVVSEAPA
jgi:hypothetical protein